jgi:hypothetical protein
MVNTDFSAAMARSNEIHNLGRTDSGQNVIDTLGQELANVTLDEDYVVCDHETRHLVESRVRRDSSHVYAKPETRQAVELVRTLLAALRGAPADQVACEVEVRGPARLGIYYHLWRLSYEVQCALILLAACGETTMHKDSRHLFSPHGAIR